MRKLTKVYHEGELIDWRVEEMTLAEKLAWHWRFWTGKQQPYSVLKEPK
jgi:hypothetical protein